MQDLHPVARSILTARGVADEEAFLNPEYEQRHDPFAMKDMEVAVERILTAIKSGEKIAAWTDYDCDGIPAGALLADFFRAIEYPLRSYIPERSEGYSLNKEGLQRLKDEGVSLIITADCGITDIEEVQFAKSLGIDVIVTDHHLPGAELPPALAVINPHRADDTYPFKELCGTGVAFKLVEALIQKGDFSLTPGWEKWLLDLVALATVADMVSLTGENRVFVHYGLIVARKGRRRGLKALLEKMRIPPASLIEDEFSFSIAPKINAASRMESPQLALELLTTQDPIRAKELAAQLVKLNDARKLEGARVSKEVKRRIAGLPESRVIVMGNSSWKPALLGIAATGVVETHQRTVCLWGKEGNLIKGSCRSDGSVNIVALMKEAEEMFEDFGGHERSGGFSLKEESIHTLPQVLEQAYASLATAPTETQTGSLFDATLSLSEANSSLYNALRKLAPFGMGNKKPIFRFPRVRVEKLLRFGAHKDHARLTLGDDNGKTLDAISFFVDRTSYRDEIDLLSIGDYVTLDGALEQSSFGGRRELRLRVEMLAFAP